MPNFAKFWESLFFKDQFDQTDQAVVRVVKPLSGMTLINRAVS
jgi:hypothetical protein